MSSRRVLRGGSWNDFPDFTRSVIRCIVASSYRDNSGGFRLVREPESPRVVRGGSWFSLSVGARSAYRFRDDAAFRDNSIGFRLVREPK